MFDPAPCFEIACWPTQICWCDDGAATRRVCYSSICDFSCAPYKYVFACASFISVIPVGGCRSATVIASWGDNYLFGFMYDLFSCENIEQLALLLLSTLLHLPVIASPELPMRIP